MSVVTVDTRRPWEVTVISTFVRVIRDYHLPSSIDSRPSGDASRTTTTPASLEPMFRNSITSTPPAGQTPSNLIENSTSSSSLMVTFSAEHCSIGDLMQDVPFSCLPPSHVDPEVQGLKVIIIINCPQPGSSQLTDGPPPIGWWSKCSQQWHGDGPSVGRMSNEIMQLRIIIIVG